jgi:Ca2+-binding RTX toxin-like protein
MASFIITSANTTAQTLNFGDYGIITSGGALATSSVAAVSFTQYALLTVQGTVSSFDDGIVSTNGGQIVVAAGGVITAGSAAMSFAGGSASNSTTIENAGTLTGLQGVSFVASTLRMTNSGDISAYNGSGLEIDSQGGAVLLRNSGMIAGNAWGIISNGNSAEIYTNTGTITGQNGAMFLSNAVSLVVNTGLLDGGVYLNGGADQFNGSAGVQGDVFGGASGDTIWGGEADDKLNGDAGADVLRGRMGEDVLSGGAGADVLRGGADDDLLYGGTEADALTGGLGDDRLNGGAGVDTFVFTRNQGTDRITDFQNGTDKLDLKAFDFASLAAVRALCSASSSGLRMDVPGEGVIFVQGLTLATLTAGDVLL